jgi:predicted metal-dependent hydrolase
MEQKVLEGIGLITLIVPRNVTEQKAIQFAIEKKNWIQKSLYRREFIKNKITLFTEASDYQTRTRKLTIAKHAKSTIKSVVSPEQIIVWYPDYATVEDSRIQEVIRRAIEATWRVEAKKYLPTRVQQLAEKNGFTFKKLSIKKAGTRWGSCSHDNNINLNLQLMRLPDALLDYVILHELAHTVEKNHQASFWRLLEKVLPGARQLDKQLNNYHLRYW